MGKFIRQVSLLAIIFALLGVSLFGQSKQGVVNPDFTFRIEEQGKISEPVLNVERATKGAINQQEALVPDLLKAKAAKEQSELEVRYKVPNIENPALNDWDNLPEGSYHKGKIHVKFRPGTEKVLRSSLIQSGSKGFVTFENTVYDRIHEFYSVKEYRAVLHDLYSKDAENRKFEERHRAWGFNRLYIVQMDEKSDIKKVIKEYAALPDVEWAEPIMIEKLIKPIIEDPDAKSENVDKGDSKWTPNDPSYSSQWGFPKIQAPQAWETVKGNPAISVIIHDEGVAYNHPDLSANMHAQIGPDGTSYTFGTQNHGSHVAGTVAAVSNNGVGVAGCAGGDGSPNSGIKMMTHAMLSGSPTLHLPAATWAADRGAAISQNSWGYADENGGIANYFSTAAQTAIDYFIANGGGTVLTGGLVVFAAGNDGLENNYFPGAYAPVFAVASTTSTDAKSSFSNYGTWVDICAPGSTIYSTYNSGYGNMSGTSMACPHVSGIAALALSQGAGLGLTAVQLQQILKENTDNVDAVNAAYVGKIGGRLNAAKVIQAISAINVAPPVANFQASPTTITAGQSVNFTDLSSNMPTEWTWTFENGFPSTSNTRSPIVSWATPGTYSVSLTVKNRLGTNAITKTGYITVNAYTAPTSPVTIGTGTTSGTYWPFGVNTQGTATNRWVRSASIYTPYEIGGAGIITRLEWRPSAAQSDTRNIQIYVKHTSQNIFTGTTVTSLTADAVLVFSGTFTPNVSNWFGFDLQKQFYYNGSSNLMVIVLVNSTGTPGNKGSNCYYTTTASMHQQWTGSTEPAGNGTVNGNRPNIRITLSPITKPVAALGSPAPFYFENFEGATFPPTNWTILNADNGGNTWVSSTTFNYTTGGTKSAAHIFHDTQNENGYLITNAITLPANSKFMLSFWSYNEWPDYYGTSSVRLSTTGNTVNDFTELVWTATSVSASWVKTNIDISAYAGNTVYIAFRYQGTDAHNWYLDDVAISAILPINQTIYEGEEIELFDLSTNNPQLWQWSTPGATSLYQSSQNINAKYNVAGTYPVSLKAANPAGESEVVQNSYVTVNGRAPIADFKAKGNLTTINNKAFIPIGKTVSFTDLSQRVPTIWNWTAEGGYPTYSAQQNPTITYGGPGQFYVQLNTANNFGNDSKTELGAVVVGGAAITANLLENEGLSGYNLTNGQLPGHGQFSSGGNTYYLYEYAEEYSNTFAATIDTVFVYVRSTIGAAKNIELRIYSDAGGEPGGVIGSQTVAIGSLTANAMNKIGFASPVAVTGKFYVGFKLNYDASHNYTNHLFSFFTAADRGPEMSNFSTAWMKTGTTVASAYWLGINEVFGIETSMAIFPKVTYPNPTTPATYTLSLQAYPSEGGTVTDNTNSGPYSFGQSVSLSATPNPNFVFRFWMDADMFVSTVNNFTYAMQPANHTLTATFVRLGDVCNDGVLNVIDIVWLVNYIIGNTPTGFLTLAADINGDSQVDALDVTALVNRILNIAKSDESIVSNPAWITLKEDGTVTLLSDGTLAAVQFRMNLPETSNISFTMLSDNHQIVWSRNGTSVMGIVFSTNNLPFNHGEHALFSVTHANPNEIMWDDVFAANISADRVAVYASSPLGITEHKNEFAVVVYPNPTTGTFKVRMELSAAANVETSLLDLTGRVVTMVPAKTLTQGVHEMEFDLVNKAGTGVYIMRLVGFNPATHDIVFSREVRLIVAQ